MAKYEDFIEITKIDDYKQLIDKLQGSTPNFRQNYIFRGLGSIKYKLIPSALRKDNHDDDVINKFIDSKFCVYEMTSAVDHFKRCKMPYETYKNFDKKTTPLLLDKYGNDYGKTTPALCWIGSEDELQYKKELYVLLKFFNWVDKSGLKISSTPQIRRLIHENINFKPPQYKWPHSDFFEIISLAQHYGLPTQAMDWSYDFKTSLYFATNNILAGNDDDCVLWAFNYKLFEDHYAPHHPFPYKLQFYRPEYHSNQNLKGQKGLFTFIISDEYKFDRRSLEDIIIEDVLNNIDYNSKSKNYVRLFGLNDFIVSPDEKIFYKFIIPGELKHIFLKELYLDGYSEENLFPGYKGVVQAIENRIKLEEYENRLKSDLKINIIMSFNDNELKNIFDNNRSIIFKKSFDMRVDKIFIYSEKRGKILGYFKAREIIKNSPGNLWSTFGRKSLFESDEYMKYFENMSEGYAIITKDLTKFDYAIPIDLDMDSDYFKLCSDDENLNFLLNFK